MLSNGHLTRLPEIMFWWRCLKETTSLPSFLMLLSFSFPSSFSFSSSSSLPVFLFLLPQIPSQWLAWSVKDGQNILSSILSDFWPKRSNSPPLLPGRTAKKLASRAILITLLVHYRIETLMISYKLMLMVHCRTREWELIWRRCTTHNKQGIRIMGT